MTLIISLGDAESSLGGAKSSLGDAHISLAVQVDDVYEALRLMKSAMKQSCTDPNTGMIDMDSIQTGKTAHDRFMEAQLAEGVKSILARVRAAALTSTGASCGVRELAGEEGGEEVSTRRPNQSASALPPHAP